MRDAAGKGAPPDFMNAGKDACTGGKANCYYFDRRERDGKMTMRVGLIGCGSISAAYLKNAKELYSETFTITAVSDLRTEAAEKRADEFGIGKVLSTEEMLYDPEVDIILNLTVPAAHREIIIRALEAGKHVYTEKPFGISTEDAEAILEAQKRSGKCVGCAPDTFLGMPCQTAIKAIRDGMIGKVFGFNCICIHPTHGNENWHPDPFPYYRKGAGPMFDMGAYYLNMLIAIEGPVRSLTSMQTMNFDKRLVQTLPHKGEYIYPEVPTHIISLIEFATGTVGTFMNTLDVWNSKQPWIEIYGTEGTLILPDPNRFDGDVLISRLSYGPDAWETLPAPEDNRRTGRGVGLADMCDAICTGRLPRASAEMAAHVNEIINGFDIAAKMGTTRLMKTTCSAPLALWERP